MVSRTSFASTHTFRTFHRTHRSGRARQHWDTLHRLKRFTFVMGHASPTILQNFRLYLSRRYDFMRVKLDEDSIDNASLPQTKRENTLRLAVIISVIFKVHLPRASTPSTPSQPQVHPKPHSLASPSHLQNTQSLYPYATQPPETLTYQKYTYCPTIHVLPAPQKFKVLTARPETDITFRFSKRRDEPTL